MIQPLTPRKPLAKATETTSPAIAGNNPCWLRLDQLPGFMWSAIRSMGESVFSPLTRTRLDRIEVIANLDGNGPHTPQEIDMTAHHLRSISDPANIIEYSTTEMTKWFGGFYQAQAVQFVTQEMTYLLVTDPMGNYIYRWPTGDTVGHSKMVAVTRRHVSLDRTR